MTTATLGALSTKVYSIAFCDIRFKQHFIPISFSGVECLSSPFNFKITAFCDLDVELNAYLNQSICFKFTNGENEHFINGIITNIDGKADDVKIKQTVTFTLSPHLTLLKQSYNCRIFQNKTQLEIVEEVLKSHAIDYDVSGITNKQSPLNYITQFNESDFNFVSRLLANVGIFYYFQMSQSKATLMLCDSIAKLANENQSFEFTNSKQDGEYIHRFEANRKVTVHHVMSKDYNPLTAHLDLSTQLKQSQNINSINKLSMFHWPGDYQNQSQGQRQVKQDLSCYQWQSAIIDGASNIPKLMAGMRFQVASSSVKGQFYAIEVQHHGYDYSQLPEQASQALGQNQDGELEPIQSYDNKFQAVSALSTFAPLKIAKPQIRGYIPALIVGLKDQSLYTDNLGRVKVEFPWDLRDLHSSKSSCWLRLSQMATGTNFNSHFTPRVGDEVSVIFVDGNIDKPLCLGCNYHGDKQSPYLLPELQPKSGIKTRLIKDGQTVQDKNKGHELCFDDTVNSEALTLTAQNALNAMVKHDDEVTIYKQRQQHIKGKNLLNVGEQHQLISAKALSLSAGQGQIQLLPKSILFKASNTSMG